MSGVASADIESLAQAMRESAQNSDITTHSVLVHSSNYLKSDMEARVPVKTGALRQSIEIRVEGDKIIIGPTAKHGPFVEFDTKPHEIKAKPGKALRFMVGGKTVIVKSVKHPGTTAQPFVRPAFEAWVDTLGGLVAEAHIKRLVDKAK